VQHVGAQRTVASAERGPVSPRMYHSYRRLAQRPLAPSAQRPEGRRDQDEVDGDGDPDRCEDSRPRPADDACQLEHGEQAARASWHQVDAVPLHQPLHVAS
jgi:hypothetical protein